MIKRIYDHRGEKQLRTEIATPNCGEDFCDRCGDCLDCYGGDPCPEADGLAHSWVEYEKEPVENVLTKHYI